MRKGLLYAEYTLKGNNFKYLIAYLNNKKISVYSFKELGEGKVKVLIDYFERRKFFAICKNMCYNIQKTYYKGILSPIFNAVKNFGITIGIILFILTVYFSNDYILAIDCKGTGSVFSNEIIALANDYGISLYSKYSDAEVLAFKQMLLSSNPDYSFVSIEKRGNRVIINSVFNTHSEEPLGKNVKDVECTVNGVVESINVLRGTALVSVGDVVKKGDKLVGAYILGKEDKIYPTYVVATVTVLEEITKIIKCENVSESSIKNAIITAKFLEEDDVVGESVFVKDNEIAVTLIVRRVILGG